MFPVLLIQQFSPFPQNLSKIQLLNVVKKALKALSSSPPALVKSVEKELENEIVEIARSYGMRILGPNIVGVLFQTPIQ